MSSPLLKNLPSVLQMTYIYEVSSFAYYDILYYCFVSFELFQKFHKLERTFAECTFCVPTYISSFFVSFLSSDFDLLFIKGLLGQGCWLWI